MLESLGDMIYFRFLSASAMKGPAEGMILTG
jgi:hypothetical protein